MGSTNLLRNELLDHILDSGTTPYTPPSILYLALFTTPTSDAGGGTEVVNDFAYVRKQLFFDTVAAAQAKSNDADTIFPAAATSTWGNVQYGGIMSSATWGSVSTTMLIHAQLAAAKVVGVDDVIRFNAGTITISFTA